MNANNFDDLINDNNVNNQNRTSNINMETVTRDTYTDEEIHDVNNITVTIPDPNTSIVVFFGSPASGKTLALLRMIRFLEGHDQYQSGNDQHLEDYGKYQVVPEAVFRPQTDLHYAKMCTNLKDMAYSQYAPGGTDVISFMLVKILDSVGEPICQFLEAPGEHYFDGTSALDFPTYIHAIRTAPNRKVWVFFVEQDWGRDQNERNLYAQKICSMQGLISPKDKIVFLFNKSDRHRHQYKKDGMPNKKAFFTNIQHQYPGIFTKYQNRGLMKVLYGEYNFKAVCFSSGVFTSTNDGREVWTPEKGWYCQELRNVLTK